MHRSNCLILALVAGSACAGAALAQDADVLSLPAQRVAVQQGGYSSRVNQLVYSINAATRDFRNVGTTKAVYDDISMSPGPGAGGNICINGIGFATVQPATGTDNDVSVRFTFFNTHLGGASTPPWESSSILGQVTYDLRDFNTPGLITFYDEAVPFPTGTAPICVPDNNFGVLMEIFSYQTTTYHPTVYSVGYGPGAPVVGSSDGTRWVDVDNNGVIDSTETLSSSEANPRRAYLIIQGDAPPPPQPASTPVGPLVDTGNTVCGSLNAGESRFYQFNLTGDITDAARHFLDIDTEGSAADVSIAVYDVLGMLVGQTGFDEDEGSGVNAQLSYGVGRRAAVGDGVQFDGRDGEVLAGDSYYVVVAPAGATFGDAFTVNAGTSPGGAFCINFDTNVNGTPLAPSVTPDQFFDIGTIPAPGTPGVAVDPDPFTVHWYRFEVADQGCGSEQYLDIDFSQSTNGADTHAYLFNSAGNLIAESDDADADGADPVYRKSQFSFGNTGPRPALDPLAQPFAGQNGPLAPGVYYLAVGLWEVVDLEGSSTDGRFHVRGTSGSTLTIQPDFYTGCGQSGGCGSADFDNDGDTGTDLDIEAFFACLGGNCCATCGSADFDSDGDTGTDLDIEAFFRVLGGGTC